MGLLFNFTLKVFVAVMDEFLASVAVRVIEVTQGVYVNGFVVTVKVQVAVL